MIGRTNSTFGGSISLPDGSTATANDVQTWLKCAGINKSYTSVSQVVADTDTMFLLMSDENAMKYLARSTDFADTICADETSMTYLGQSAYVDSTILNSDLWVSAVCDSQHFESVLNVKVPTMTSNTTPSGKVLAETQLAWGDTAYKMFDNNDSTRTDNSYWNSSDFEVWFGYKFDSEITIKKVVLFAFDPSNGEINDINIYLQASNDGNNWVTIQNIGKPIDFINTNKTISISNNLSYQYYRIFSNTAWVVHSSKYGLNGVYTLQLYGRYQK